MIDDMINGSRLEAPTDGECLALLASVPVGRVVYTDRALPAIAVVHHLVHHGDIVFRDLAGGRLDAATRRGVVAYQADSIDPEDGTGWSVVALGEARRVTSKTEADLLSMLPLRSWLTAPEPGVFVRIRIELITGRRVVREQGPDPEIPCPASTGPQ